MAGAHIASKRANSRAFEEKVCVSQIKFGSSLFHRARKRIQIRVPDLERLVGFKGKALGWGLGRSHNITGSLF